LGNNPDPVTGKPFKSLPPGSLTPANGTCAKYGGSDSPFNNNIVLVTGGEETQHALIISKYQQRGAVPIDPWK
jgi:hypothetical protein